MTFSLSDIVRANVQYYFDIDKNHWYVLNHININLRQTKRMYNNWKQWKKMIDFYTKFFDRFIVLQQKHFDVFLKYVAIKFSIYLNELIWFLYDDFDFVICEITIWNNLKRLKWNKKNFFKIIAKRNVAFRVEWTLKFIRWTIKQLIFIDEFVVNERTNDKKTNWFFVETSFYVIHKFHRNKKWNILSILTIDNYIIHLIHHNNIIVVIFNDFIRYNVFCKSQEMWHQKCITKTIVWLD